MKIISVDCETDGLYGPIWAIGAVCHETRPAEGGEPLPVGVFGSRCLEWPNQLSSQWVRDTVWDSCTSLPIQSRRADMFASFATWWLDLKSDAITIADVGVPVEAGLFRELVTRELIGKFDGPYPLHEVATMLRAAGIGDVDRAIYAGQPPVWIGRSNIYTHNPIFDSWASLVCWQRAQGILDANRH